MSVNGSLPVLGGHKPRLSAPVTALVFALDEAGLIEVDHTVMAPDGTVLPALERQQYVSAFDLVEMIRLVVRAEIERAQRREEGSEG